MKISRKSHIQAKQLLSFKLSFKNFVNFWYAAMILLITRMTQEMTNQSLFVAIACQTIAYFVTVLSERGVNLTQEAQNKVR